MTQLDFGGAIDWLLSMCALVSVLIIFWTPARRRRDQPAGSSRRSARIRATTGFLVFGMFIVLIWLRLNSVDVALAEAALGGGFLAAILVYLAVATTSKPASPHTSTETQPLNTTAAPQQTTPRRTASSAVLAWLTGILGLATLVGVGALWLQVPQSVPQWEGTLEPQMGELGVEHPVTGVLLAFRAYDTFLETAVVLFAAVVAWVLAQQAQGNEVDQPSANSDRRADIGREPILNGLMRILTPLFVLLALWFIFAGSTDSGGAFQAGVVVSAALIGLHITGIVSLSLHTPAGPQTPSVNTTKASHSSPEGSENTTLSSRSPIRIPGWLFSTALIGGVVAFLISATLGPLTGSAWFSLEPPWAFGAILSVEILLSIGIGAALTVIYIALQPGQDAQPVLPHRSSEHASEREAQPGGAANPDGVVNPRSAANLDAAANLSGTVSLSGAVSPGSATTPDTSPEADRSNR